jgi:SAM-dependent methyltransferase
MAERLTGAAGHAVQAAEVSARDRVLDVACGNGNAALLAAERGATVVGVDVEPVLLAQARERADVAGVRVDWLQADAAQLPLPGDSFSVVLSVFGVMYAHDHARAALELARVCMPGGRVALASWVPASFMPAIGGVLAPYLPPPAPGSAPPSRWGDELELPALLEQAGMRIDSMSRWHLALELSDLATAVDFLLDTAGHVLAEHARLTSEGRWQALREEVSRLVERHDEGTGDEVVLRLEYLTALASAVR